MEYSIEENGLPWSPKENPSISGKWRKKKLVLRWTFFLLMNLIVAECAEQPKRKKDMHTTNGIVVGMHVFGFTMLFNVPTIFFFLFALCNQEKQWIFQWMILILSWLGIPL